MEILFVLITWFAAGYAFPTPKIENSSAERQQIGGDDGSHVPLQLAADGGNGLEENGLINGRIRDKAKEYGQGRTFGILSNLAVGGLVAALDILEEVILDNSTWTREDVGNFTKARRREEASTTPEIENTPDVPITTEMSFQTQSYESIDEEILHEIHRYRNNSNGVRQIRQDDKENQVDSNENDGDEENEDDDGGGAGGGLLGAIISGFLGSLSKPDGGVDVDAVVSVVGSLSAMNEDGTYDFSGLEDTLNAFFGGGDDGGGSDVGSFAGGALAAVIRGLASPPGAKGAGTFIGNLLKQVLPALSGPGTSEEGVTTIKPQVNAGGFLWGLLKSLFGGNPNNSENRPGMFYTIKTNLIKFVFSALSSILTSSSSSGKKDW